MLLARVMVGMKEWGPWDWLAWGTLGLSALFVAVDTAIAGLPNLAASLPQPFHELYLGVVPLAAFAISATVFISRELGIIPTARHPPAVTKSSEEKTSTIKTLIITDIPSENRSVWLTLQFYKGDVSPTEVSRQNILSWHALWRSPLLVKLMGQENKIVEELAIPKNWTIFLVFDRPSSVHQIIMQSIGGETPPYEVKWVTTICAIIITNSDIAPGIYRFGSIN